MCPFCISTATWFVVGGVSTGGLLTFGVNNWRKSKRTRSAPIAKPD